MNKLNTNVPPVPDVDVTGYVANNPFSLSPYVPYVFSTVLYNGKGEMAYSDELDMMILHLSPTPGDCMSCMYLEGIQDVWIGIKAGMKSPVKEGVIIQ